MRATISRAEQAIGAPATAAFVAMLAVGRSGWREQDLCAVVPSLAGQLWDPSVFAQFREVLGAHLVWLAPSNRLDVRSEDERIGCGQYLRGTALDLPKVHLAVALHLLALGPSDPLRVTETMHHLLGAHAWSRAASYLADLEPESASAQSARHVMAALVRASPSDDPTSGAAILTHLLHAGGVDMTARLRVAAHLLQVHYGTQGRCSLQSEATLLDAVEAVVGQIHRDQPHDPKTVDVYAQCLTWRGNLRRDQGDFAASVADLRRADELRKQSKSGNRTPAGTAEPPHLGIGDALMAQGDLDGAMAIYAHPAHVQSPIAQQRIGNVLRGRGDLSAALLHFQRGLDGLKRLLTVQPNDDATLLNAAIATSTIATTHLMMGAPRKAVALYEEGEVVLAGVAARHPAEPHIHSEWALMHYRKGQAQQACADFDSARLSYEQGFAILGLVVRRHPDNPHYRFQQALFGLGLGEVQMHAGDIRGARERWHESLQEISALIARHDDSQEWLALSLALRTRLEATSLQRRALRTLLSGLSRLRRSNS